VGGYAPLAVVTGGGSLYWVHGNHLGVPIVITDSAGNLAAPTGYTPVGFPGQTRTLADLYYNRYRDYDPTTGRYIQADPIGLRGGGNPYLYANANPLRFTDPSGRNPIVIGMLIGALVDLGIELWEHRNEKCWNFNWRRLGTSVLTGGALGWAGGFLGGGAAAAEAGGGAAAEAGGAAGVADGGTAAARARAGDAAVGAGDAGAVEGGIDAAGATKAGSQIDRGAFAGERQAYWQREATSNPDAYSEGDLARMQAGKPPIGSDGYPTELHHVDGTPEGDLQPMTRTDHRLGDNYKANHPWLGK